MLLLCPTLGLGLGLENGCEVPLVIDRNGLNLPIQDIIDEFEPPGAELLLGFKLFKDLIILCVETKKITLMQNELIEN